MSDGDDGPAAAFVVRVTTSDSGRAAPGEGATSSGRRRRHVIRMQDLRTGEVREFASWAEFLQYAEGAGKPGLR